MSAGQPMIATLAAELAAIYAYGVIGVRLAAAGDQAEARAAEEAHRRRRDYLVTRMDELKITAAAAPAGYQLPFPVIDRVTAVRLAIRVEDGVAQAWRPVLPVTQGADRAAALSAMTDAAVRATRWRRLAAVTPLTLPFPGRPTA